MIKLSTSNFKWKEIEQVYPFERSSNDEPLYCKQVTFTTSASASSITYYNHNIQNMKYMHGFLAILDYGNSISWAQNTFTSGPDSAGFSAGSVQVTFKNPGWGAWASKTATVQIKYTKL